MNDLRWEELTHDELVDAKIFSTSLSGHRVDVYVPSEVTSTTPLLVMHDGKNLLWPEHSTMGQTWGVIDVVQTLATRPVVVGVWGLVDPQVPAIRYFELAPQRALEADPSLIGSLLSNGSIPEHEYLGDAYHDMLALELLPQVANFLGLTIDRTRTALCGSSMGGITSLYGASRYPEIYGSALSLSTHWAYWDARIIEAVLSELPHAPRPRVWIDRGTEELDALYDGLHERAAAYLASHGWDTPRSLQAKVYEGTNHSEPVWRERLPEILTWWLDGMSSETSG